MAVLAYGLIVAAVTVPAFAVFAYRIDLLPLSSVIIGSMTGLALLAGACFCFSEDDL